MLNAQQIDLLKTILTKKLNELNELREASADARAPVSLDQTSVGRISRIDAMQQQAMAQAQERQRVLDLNKIERALERIKSKNFGYCLACDEEIAFKRLQVDPAATLCIGCAMRAKL